MPYVLDDKLLLFVSVSTPLIYNHIINNYSSDNLEHNATKWCIKKLKSFCFNLISLFASIDKTGRKKK
jgi:hypothetical protein